MAKPPPQKKKPLTEKKPSGLLFSFIRYVVLLSGRHALFPPAWQLEAANDKKHLTMSLIFDCVNYFELASLQVKLRTLTITSDLLRQQLLMIPVGFISTYAASLFFSSTIVQKLHLGARVAVVVATSFVLSRRKFPEEEAKSEGFVK